MSDHTKIEWTDATANVINGCTVKSAGCIGCYAMKQAHRFPVRRGLTKQSNGGMVWTGEVRFNEAALLQVLRWKKPRMIFWNAHGDMFHENVPDEWIDRCFAVMALTPHHTHQVLTKRADRMREYCNDPRTPERIAALLLQQEFYWPVGSKVILDALSNRAKEEDPEFIKWPLPKVWLGVSVENQAAADQRIPDLLATPAAVRWISAEPLIGPVNLEPWLAPIEFCQGCDDGEGYGNRCARSDIPREEQCPLNFAVQTVIEHGPFSDDGEPNSMTCEIQTLDWVVCGGESGPKARPMHPDWARSLRDQCADAGVPFLFKQWGEFGPVEHEATVASLRNVTVRYGKKAAGRHLDGVLHDAYPMPAEPRIFNV